MSAADANSSSTKKFGKGERTIPHHSQKASRFYPAYDEKQQKKVCAVLALLAMRRPARRRFQPEDDN